jgi:hypothetical protein
MTRPEETEQEQNSDYINDCIQILTEMTTTLVSRPHAPCPIPAETEPGLGEPCWISMAYAHHALFRAFRIPSAKVYTHISEQLDYIRRGTLLWVSLPRTAEDIEQMEEVPCRCPAATPLLPSHTRRQPLPD